MSNGVISTSQELSINWRRTCTRFVWWYSDCDSNGLDNTPLVCIIFSVISSVIIYELQSREILSGDASIAIFLTGMLGLGLVVLRIWGGGITTDIEGYMFGSLLLVDNQSLNLIIIIFVITLISIFAV